MSLIRRCGRATTTRDGNVLPDSLLNVTSLESAMVGLDGFPSSSVRSTTGAFTGLVVVDFHGLLPGPVESPPTLLLSVGLAAELAPLLATGDGVLVLTAFWLGGGLGGLILRLGTVGVGVAGVGAGDGGFDAGTFWLLGTVFGCILMLVVRVCTAERVWVVGALLTTVGVLARLVVFWMTGVP